jgi:hypothetical protein
MIKSSVIVNGAGFPKSFSLIKFKIGMFSPITSIFYLNEICFSKSKNRRSGGSAKVPVTAASVPSVAREHCTF